jgi:dihydrofolate reductase
MIVAVNRVGAIGLNGGLPWGHNKEDLRQFRRKTLNNLIIVGRTTFDALPMIFDHRITVVLTTADTPTRHAMFAKWHDMKMAKAQKAKTPAEASEIEHRSKLVFAGDVAEAVEFAELSMRDPNHPNRRAFVGGGDKVYNAFLDYVGIVHQTNINDFTPGDTKLTVNLAAFYTATHEEAIDHSCSFVRLEHSSRLFDNKLSEPYLPKGSQDVENQLG